jgi:CRP/FNR family transcriptional regulator
MSSRSCRQGCASCPSSVSVEWRSISASGLKFLEKYKHERRLKPGEVIHKQGDPSAGIYCLREGLVGERRVDCEGRSILVRLHHPGESFGYRETLSGTAYANSVEALRESQLCFIGRPILSELIARYPSLSSEFLQRSLRDCRRLEDSLVEAKTFDVKRRFLQVLLELYKKSGAADECDEPVFDIPVTRRDLAGLVGTVPETLSRTIRQIEKEGLVHLNGQRAYFLNLVLVSRELHGPQL